MKINYFHKYEAGCFYHLYNHGSGDKNLFLNHNDYVDFKNKFDKYFLAFFEVWAYCLMPNHFHFLIQVKQEEQTKEALAKKLDSSAKQKFLKQEIDLNELLEDQFRRLFSAYSLKYNNKYKERGQLFLNRHRRILLRSEERVKYIFCYIHHNPIHHKFRNTYQDWTYSSFHDLQNKAEQITECIEYFGGLAMINKMHDDFKINYNNNYEDEIDNDKISEQIQTTNE